MDKYELVGARWFYRNLEVGLNRSQLIMIKEHEHVLKGLVEKTANTNQRERPKPLALWINKSLTYKSDLLPR